jgi:molecular chaperone GrpE
MSQNNNEPLDPQENQQEDLKKDEIKSEANTTVNEKDQTDTSEETTADEKVADPAFKDEDALNQLLDQLAETKDKYLRLYAEFDNYKKRTAKENLELRQTASKDVIFSLLEVLDDCNRAEAQMNSTDDIALAKEGIQLVFNKFKRNLEEKGVKVMDAKGADFNVDLHEAITEIPAPSEDQKGKIIDVVQNGYYLNDKLIRFAKVVVGN